MKRLSLFIAVTSLSLFGWGCKPSDVPTSNLPPPTSRTPDIYLPPEPPPESEMARNLRELREAIINFQSARTFRAKIAVTSANQKLSGQIDIMKPNRFHGTLQMPGKDGAMELMEVIGVENSLYIRLAENIWTYLKNPEQAKALTQAYRSAVDGEGSVLTTVLPDGTDVTKTRDAAMNCDRYVAPVKDADGSKMELRVCVAGGMPKRIDIVASAGSAAIDYFDYNKLITIERPLGIRME
jgi:hypothetical protein